MKMEWTDSNCHVLRIAAQSEEELDIIATLLDGPCQVAHGIYANYGDAPFGQTRHGRISHIRGLRLLVGLEWKIGAENAADWPQPDKEICINLAIARQRQSEAELRLTMQKAEQAHNDANEISLRIMSFVAQPVKPDS